MSNQQQPLTGIFDSASQQRFQEQLGLSPLVFQSPMLLQTQPNTVSKASILAMSTSHVYLFDAQHPEHSPVACYPIDFECQFSFVETNQQPCPEAQANPQTVPCSFTLRLERTNRGSMDFHGESLLALTRWRELLTDCMNQRNFHQLFTPIRKLKQGTFASVYLVKRNCDGKMFAAKAFSKEGLYGRKYGKESLINQIKIMRQFHDEGLLAIHGTFESINSIYVICELMEGRHLQEEMQFRQFAQPETKEIIKKLLHGLDVLASRSVTHRDLKPENIMFRTKGSCDAVIIDFGLATCSTDNQRLFSRCGTPGFVAPEIINNKQSSTNCTPASDIFSLGLIFYEMLQGKSIFNASSPAELFAQNKLCNFACLNEQLCNISKEGRQLLSMMLQIDPLQRISVKEALKHPYFNESPAILALPYPINKYEFSLSTSHSLNSNPSTPKPIQKPLRTIRRPSESLLEEDSTLSRKRPKLTSFGIARPSQFANYENSFSQIVQASS